MVKLEKIETFTLSGLTGDDMAFLSEVFEKITLSEDSTQASKDLLEKWKKLLQVESRQCVGCDTTENVAEALCPLTDQLENLCEECYNKREELANESTDSQPSE